MTTTAVPSITPLPSAPDPANRSTFNTLAYPWSAALPTFGSQVTAVANATYANAVDAYSSSTNASVSATTAASLVAAAGATNWVSGETFGASGTHPGIGDARVSLLDFQSYRRITTGGGTTDPKNDATNWIKVSTGAATGGAVASTGSVVLGNSSGAGQLVTPTAYGQSVTLPNATTCPLSGLAFNFKNNSPYPMRVKDAAGTTLGFIGAYQGGNVSLVDNSTTAGVWGAAGLLPYAVTAQKEVAALNSTLPVRVVVDANRSLFLCLANNALIGIVYDASTQTWGSYQTIRAAVVTGPHAGIATTTDQVLVTSYDGAASVVFQTLTITGTAITANTTYSAGGGGGAITAFHGIVSCGSTYVVCFKGSTVALLAATIAGTVVTIGTAVTTSGTVSTAMLYSVSSTQAMVITASSTILYAQPYTISAGTTLTAGSAGTIACGTVAGMRSFVLGSRWGVVFSGTTDYVSAGVISISGANATISGIQNILSSTTFNPLTFGEVAVYGSKFLVTAAYTTSHNVNLCTDTGGTLTVGTPLALAYSATTNSVPALISTSGSTATVLIQWPTKTVLTVFELSGSSAVVSSTQMLDNPNATYGVINPSDKQGNRSGDWLKGAAVSYGITTKAPGVNMVIAASMMVPTLVTVGRCGPSFTTGAPFGNTEAWLTSSSTSLTLQCVECAA